ncbi:MAG: OPT/YSL family transporter [Planctomycetota bacterium]
MSDEDASVSVEPPTTKPYREVTVSAIVTGVAIGLVMNAAITYSGLKIGFTIGGSAIAAVLGFAVLRGILRKGSIVETNIVQTVASAVGNSNAGVIFTIPALLLLGREFNPWIAGAACVAGVILGVAFIIPLRRQMLDLERLRFPSATAVAAILRAPGAGPAKAIVLVAGVVIAALIYLPTQTPKIKLLVSADDVSAIALEMAQEQQTEHRERDPVRAARDLFTLPEQSFAAERGTTWFFERYNHDDVRRTQLIARWVATGRVDDEWVFRAAQGAEEIQGTAAAMLAQITEIQAEPDDDIDVRTLRAAPYWASRPMPGYGALNIRGFRTSERDPDEADRAVTDSVVDVGALIGIPAAFGLIFAITPLSFGAGFLTGRPGLVVTAGGVLAFIIIAPVAAVLGWIPVGTPPAAVSEAARGLITRPIGIGMLMGGAVMGVIAAFPAIKAAFAGMGRAKNAALSGAARDELPVASLAFAVIGSAVVLFLAAHFGGAGEESSGPLAALNPWVRHGLIAIVGTVWIWFAGIIIAQCAGMTDWSPISGLALMTVLVIVVLTDEVVAAVMVGAAVCVAISLAADMMGDLRTGGLVGAIPRRQQLVELATVGLGPAVAIIVTIALHEAFTLGSPEFPAPQGVALQKGIEGLQGAGLPYALYGFGILLGGLLGVGSFAGLGVLVGLSMYLPVVYIFAYGLGCLANQVVEAIKGREWTAEWCTPFFGGVIIGESVLGLIFAGYVILSG